jgi:serine/threonine protein kinase
MNDPFSEAATVHSSGPSPIPDRPSVPDHEMLRCVGRGAYGEVWLARTILGTCRAVKVVYRRRFENARPFEREFLGIQKFEPISRSHEHLVHILHVGRNEQDGYFYYVMELADDASAGCGARNAESTAVAPASIPHSSIPHSALPTPHSE